MDKFKTLIPIIVGTLTIGGLFVNSIIGFAKAEDKITRHEETITEQDKRIRKVEDSTLKQEIILNQIKEGQTEAKESTKRIIDLLEKK